MGNKGMKPLYSSNLVSSRDIDIMCTSSYGCSSRIISFAVESGREKKSQQRRSIATAYQDTSEGVQIFGSSGLNYRIHDSMPHVCSSSNEEIPFSLFFLPHGRLISISPRVIRLYLLEEAMIIASIDMPETRILTSAHVSGQYNSRFVWLGTSTGEVLLFDTSIEKHRLSGYLIKISSIMPQEYISSSINSQLTSITSLAILSTDYSQLLIGLSSGVILSHNIVSQKLHRAYPPTPPSHSNGSVNSIAWTPNGEMFLAGYQNGLLCLWQRKRHTAPLLQFCLSSTSHIPLSEVSFFFNSSPHTPVKRIITIESTEDKHEGHGFLILGSSSKHQPSVRIMCVQFNSSGTAIHSMRNVTPTISQASPLSDFNLLQIHPHHKSEKDSMIPVILTLDIEGELVAHYPTLHPPPPPLSILESHSTKHPKITALHLYSNSPDKDSRTQCDDVKEFIRLLGSSSSQFSPDEFVRDTLVKQNLYCLNGGRDTEDEIEENKSSSIDNSLVPDPLILIAGNDKNEISIYSLSYIERIKPLYKFDITKFQETNNDNSVISRTGLTRFLSSPHYAHTPLFSPSNATSQGQSNQPNRRSSISSLSAPTTNLGTLRKTSSADGQPPSPVQGNTTSITTSLSSSPPPSPSISSSVRSISPSTSPSSSSPLNHPAASVTSVDLISPVSSSQSVNDAEKTRFHVHSRSGELTVSTEGESCSNIQSTISTSTSTDVTPVNDPVQQSPKISDITNFKISEGKKDETSNTLTSVAEISKNSDSQSHHETILATSLTTTASTSVTTDPVTLNSPTCPSFYPSCISFILSSRLLLIGASTGQFLLLRFQPIQKAVSCMEKSGDNTSNIIVKVDEFDKSPECVATEASVTEKDVISTNPVSSQEENKLEKKDSDNQISATDTATATDASSATFTMVAVTPGAEKADSADSIAEASVSTSTPVSTSLTDAIDNSQCLFEFCNVFQHQLSNHPIIHIAPCLIENQLISIGVADNEGNCYLFDNVGKVVAKFLFSSPITSLDVSDHPLLNHAKKSSKQKYVHITCRDGSIIMIDAISGEKLGDSSLSKMEDNFDPKKDSNNLLLLQSISITPDFAESGKQNLAVEIIQSKSKSKVENSTVQSYSVLITNDAIRLFTADAKKPFLLNKVHPSHNLLCAAIIQTPFIVESNDIHHNHETALTDSSDDEKDDNKKDKKMKIPSTLKQSSTDKKAPQFVPSPPSKEFCILALDKEGMLLLYSLLDLKLIYSHQLDPSPLIHPIFNPHTVSSGATTGSSILFSVSNDGRMVYSTGYHSLCTLQIFSPHYYHQLNDQKSKFFFETEFDTLNTQVKRLAPTSPLPVPAKKGFFSSLFSSSSSESPTLQIDEIITLFDSALDEEKNERYEDDHIPDDDDEKQKDIKAAGNINPPSSSILSEFYSTSTSSSEAAKPTLSSSSSSSSSSKPPTVLPSDYKARIAAMKARQDASKSTKAAMEDNRALAASNLNKMRGLEDKLAESN